MVAVQIFLKYVWEVSKYFWKTSVENLGEDHEVVYFIVENLGEDREVVYKENNKVFFFNARRITLTIFLKY